MGAQSEAIVKSKWDEIVPVYVAFRRHKSFDLALPCVLVTGGGDVLATSLSSIASHLKTSVAMSSPPMIRYFESLAEHKGGAIGAFEDAINGDDGEEFAGCWDEAQEDIRKGCRCSVDDVVRMVSTAKEGFSRSPKQMLAVVDDGESLEVSLVCC